MALQRLTVLTKNGDSAYAGTVMFNSDLIQGAKEHNGTGTSFFYRRTDEDRTPDKYTVSDSVGTISAIYAAASGTYAIVTFRDDINDSTSDTTNKVIDLDDIVKGIELPSDTTQSLLWIKKGTRKTVKVLVDKFLKALTDLSTSGTTTTYE